MGPSSGSRAGICCRLGLDIDMRPETLPPSSDLIWLMCVDASICVAVLHNRIDEGAAGLVQVAGPDD